MISVLNLSESFSILQYDSPQFSPELEMRVNELWQAALSSLNSRLFNGLVFSAKTVDETGIKGYFTEYKYLMAQRLDPRLKPFLKINPVSLLGFLSCKDGILFGKRQDWVATRPNEWGFLPSGYITPDTFSHDGRIDYVKAFLIELKNELNMEAHYLTDLSHHSLVIDTTAEGDHYSIVMQADIALSSMAVKKEHMNAPDDEYAEIVAIPAEDVGLFLNGKNNKDMLIAESLLDKEGYLKLESNCA